MAGVGVAPAQVAVQAAGQHGVVAVVRTGQRLQEVQAYSAMTGSLLRLSDRLRCLGVTRVVMEATSDYWRQVFYVLEAAGFETWLVNEKDVKHLPGRPQTDKLDCIWLCKVAERQMIRPSSVPPPEIRRRREVTRWGGRTPVDDQEREAAETVAVQVGHQPAAISPGSSPNFLSALSEVAPRSRSTGSPPSGRRWMQAR